MEDVSSSNTKDETNTSEKKIILKTAKDRSISPPKRGRTISLTRIKDK